MPRRRQVIPVACEPCRTRKARCDGLTPACNPCIADGTPCTYTSDPRTPRPIALRAELERLKSAHARLIEIYDRLKVGDQTDVSALIRRIRSTDEILDIFSDQSLAQRPSPSQNSVLHHALPGLDGQWRDAKMPPRGSAVNLELPGDNVEEDFSTETTQQQKQPVNYLRSISNISVSHRVLFWPEIFRMITRANTREIASELKGISKNGSPWFLKQHMLQNSNHLPTSVKLPHIDLASGCIIFPSVSVQQVNEYSAAYFDTYNVLLPLLDMASFMDTIAAKILQQGYRENDADSVLALLVFALGKLAVEGASLAPTSRNCNEASGFRGGTPGEPPGLALFNEARRRIGLVNMQTSLEHVQILLLEATYFEANARHAEFWSITSAASMACNFLVKSQVIDWTSLYGDLVKRAYWICVLHESLFDLDIRVAATGLEKFQDEIPLPHFHGLSEQEDSLDAESCGVKQANSVRQVDFAYEFVAMVSLSRLLRRVDSVVHRYERGISGTGPLFREKGVTDDTAIRPLTSFSEHDGPASSLVEEMIRQLDSWRLALPRRLQWNDENRLEFPDAEAFIDAPSVSYFSSLLNAGPGKMYHNADIAVAQIRTRFYQARFLILRPYIYKALHKPQSLSVIDRSRCALAIDAACHWPLSLAPPKNKKHLVPHLFSWTQNFLAILLILQAVRQSPLLRHICGEEGIALSSVENSIDCMMIWLDDLKQLDGVAEWSLRVLNAVINEK